MAPGVVDECRAKLEEDRAELQISINELQGGEMTTEEAAESAALVDTLLETLKEVEDALLKMSLGTFGICESCQGRITDERLVAMPAARLCFECADVQATVLTSSPDVE